MNIKSQFFLIMSIVFFTTNCYSQKYSDVLIDKNNTKTYCKVIQIKNGKIKYKLRGKSYSTTKSIVNFSDVELTNIDVIKNPLGIQIEKPELGYAYVYFYYSGVIYNLKHNGEKLPQIGLGCYYLHKIKSGSTHKYSSHWSDLEFFAEDQETYFIRSEINAVFSNPSGIGGTMTTKLVLDIRKVSEYALLSMKKKIED